MTGKISKKRKLNITLLKALMYLSAFLTCAIVLFLIIYVLAKGVPNITWELLSTKPSYLTDKIGILPDILNTLYIILATLIIVLPLGVGAAVYLTEYAKNKRVVSAIEFAAETLSGIPSTLDESWTPENLKRNMGARAYYGNRRAEITYPPQMPTNLREWYKPFRRTSHIYRLYLHYCYLLGVLPEKSNYKPTSPYLKEDLRKLDELSAQVRYMGDKHIETLEDLYADRKNIEGSMERLIGVRKKLQNKIRRATPAEKEVLREEKSEITDQITALRKQLKLNKGIEERSVKIQEKTDMFFANEDRAKEEMQNKKTNKSRKERDAR